MQYENRSFLVDVLQCEKCGGRMKMIAAIDQPGVIQRILECIGVISRAPPLAPAVSRFTG